MQEIPEDESVGIGQAPARKIGVRRPPRRDVNIAEVEVEDDPGEVQILRDSGNGARPVTEDDDMEAVSDAELEITETAAMQYKAGLWWNNLRAGFSNYWNGGFVQKFSVIAGCALVLGGIVWALFFAGPSLERFEIVNYEPEQIPMEYRKAIVMSGANKEQDFIRVQMLRSENEDALRRYVIQYRKDSEFRALRDKEIADEKNDLLDQDWEIYDVRDGDEIDYHERMDKVEQKLRVTVLFRDPETRKKRFRDFNLYKKNGRWFIS